MGDDILTPEQAAKLIDVKVSTLTRWRRLGEGPDYFRTGESRFSPVRYRRASISAWAELQEHKRAFQERHERKDGGMG